MAAHVTGDELLSLYEQMAVIRRTEKAAHDLFLSGLVKGTTHLAAGHEAIAVGASAALRDDDYVFATYRGHHHAIARGATPEECLAELMSRATGLCKGQGRLHAPHQGVRRHARLVRHRRCAPARWRSAPPGRPGCGAPTSSRSPSSATARPTSAPSTRRSTWPPCGNCPCCSSARTTCTWSTRRSRTSPRCPGRPPTGHRRTAFRARSSTATTWCWSRRPWTGSHGGPGPETGPPSWRPRPTGTTGTAAPTRPPTGPPRRSNAG